MNHQGNILVNNLLASHFGGIAVQNPKSRQYMRLMCLAVLVVAEGCSQIPTQEFTNYRDAFGEVLEVSELILIDFAEIKAVAESEQRGRAGLEVSPDLLFSTNLQSFEAPQPSAVEVRRTALRTISEFNNVLTTLAEGKTVEVVQSAASGFVEAAGKFTEAVVNGAPVPGLSSIVGIVKTLVGEFEKARLRQQFKEAVHNGRPVIDLMLDELIKERSDHITLRADQATRRHLDTVIAIRSAIDDAKAIFVAHGAPVSNDPKQDYQDALNETLKPVEQQLRQLLPIDLQYSAGESPFTNEQLVVANQIQTRVATLVADYQANVTQFERLRHALNNYGLLLQKTRETLSSLEQATEKPQDFESMSEELIQIAFSIKRDIEAIKAARKVAP